MEDSCIYITSLNNSYDYSNVTYDYEYYTKVEFITFVLTCVIIGVGLFLTLIAIYCLYSQVRNDHVAPIYVINLLISDLVQFCCMIVWVTPADVHIYFIFQDIYLSALLASVVFMLCISLERYLVIACPLWYHFRRTIKSSVVVCVLVWALTLDVVLIIYVWFQLHVGIIILSVILLLPLPLFIFFLGGTLKALSASISVPSDEKRRIVAVLVLVLLIYALLFLPTIILMLAGVTRNDFNITFYVLSDIFIQLSPLADLTLYVFMRKGIIDKLLSSVCCCRMDSDDTNSPSV
ncbi:uncharacterized protein ABDE67_013996 [Symphorus nematophorus]